MPVGAPRKVRFAPPDLAPAENEEGPGATTTEMLLDGNIDGAAAFQRNEDGTVEGEAKVNEEYKSTHTLDSDDEEEEKYQRLDLEQIDGQEDDTITKDGEIKITPFNMREEMEEGHFDSEGNFIFDKEKEIKDNWLDGIEWDKAKEIAGRHWQMIKRLDEAEDAAGPSEIELYEIYDRLAAILNEKETVTRALTRLGKGRSAGDARKKRWAERRPSGDDEMRPTGMKMEEQQADMETETSTPSNLNPSQTEKKQPSGSEVKPDETVTDQVKDEPPDDETFAKPAPPKRAKTESDADSKPRPKAPRVPDEREKSITELTELVDRLVSSGEFEAYGFTKEQVLYKRDTLRMKRVKSEEAEKKEDLDMFGDDFEEKEKESTPAQPTATTSAPATSSNSVQWVFKWTQSDPQVHGPFSSEAMLEWTENKYFEKGVFVRRADQEGGQFYNSSRIDFDLYT